jgi:hypothetical protein
MHIPDISNRYYRVQLNDLSGGTDFEYVSTYISGTQAGENLVTGSD